ncbi:hypothetical protein [Bdellovibrio svalbardensis]|uniref:PepSY domain-containing protein n=1 Tax=Bdellovibrio svalbardensis TaxID=2972972 RepID=A0ABT6DJ62_9BACT|nr:hypothetical protein [Bdellovibrio svalbardensis]MDG0816260.1 hypothetical protein [Bdellovibrio svalbardensis]
MKKAGIILSMVLVASSAFAKSGNVDRSNLCIDKATEVAQSIADKKFGSEIVDTSLAGGLENILVDMYQYISSDNQGNRVSILIKIEGNTCAVKAIDLGNE